ncbi:conjugal transfer protein TraF, partial [Oleiphilus sp. HI0086]
LSYSAEVWQPPVMDSKLFAGVQLNAYHATMNKQVLALTNIAEDDDAGDAIRDEFEENTVSTTEMGVDLGLLWAFPNGHAGLTIANINEPEFKYGDIGTDCGSITDPTRRANCEVARDVFSGEISLQETAVMAAQTTIEGSLYTEDKQWLLTGAYDLNSVYDLVGRESQMISGSATYFPNSYILPTIRLGISQNLVGSELTMVGFGTTLFGMMNIDLAASLDTVELDGTKAPRRFGFNIGFEEKF